MNEPNGLYVVMVIAVCAAVLLGYATRSLAGVLIGAMLTFVFTGIIVASRGTPGDYLIALGMFGLALLVLIVLWSTHFNMGYATREHLENGRVTDRMSGIATGDAARVMFEHPANNPQLPANDYRQIGDGK